MEAAEIVPARTVHCEDAINWLKESPVLSGCSLVASLPDISEFPHYSLAEWQRWFSETAALIVSRTPEDGVSIFYQSDIKSDGEWVDKGYLCYRAAESQGASLLWHKIACRFPPGQTSFGRTGYSHVLCFSKKIRAEVSKSTPDVLPELGEKTWQRGMGLEACRMIGRFISEQTPSRTVVHVFCGEGSMLAAANACGLAAVGIERSPKRVEKARTLGISPDWKTWIK